ncbi:hypothetical protein [Pseudomonas syringae]|uniref:hypothetical protein n=1 Tax=Pseudomonas syringae TaxID=317 RepID=UPI001F2FA7FD|nr:hypothetical protein [Pseudomonas syringae]
MPSIWTIIATLLAAALVALMARQLKISEFRQSWINEVRVDVSDFISKAHEWIDLYLVFNGEPDQKVKAELAVKLDRIKYDSFQVLRRIELMFKPDDLEANDMLASLIDLLDPSKLISGRQYNSWRDLAGIAVMKSRYLLKEEWEKTKNPFRSLQNKI